MSTQRNFETEFHTEEFELLVLIKSECHGAARSGDMLYPSVSFLASIDICTGILSKEQGRIEWVIKNSENRKGWGYDLKQYGIYHILVRKCISTELKPGQMKIMSNRYMLVKVLKENVRNEALEEIMEYYKRPVSIKSELCEFVLNRDFSWFEGSVDWNGVKVITYLETDEEDGESAEGAYTKLLELAKDFTGNDERYRRYAAEKLTAGANDWLEDSGDEDGEEITEEMFAKRIEISEIVINPKGELSILYNDDDMFWGHVIEILVDADGTMSSADIAG